MCLCLGVVSEAGFCFILMVWCRKTAGAQKNHFFFLPQTREGFLFETDIVRLNMRWSTALFFTQMSIPFHFITLQVNPVMTHGIVILFVPYYFFLHLASINTQTFVYILLSHELTLSQIFPTIFKPEKSTSLLKVTLFGCHNYRGVSPDSGVTAAVRLINMSEDKIDWE